MKLFGYLFLPNAEVTRSDGYLGPVRIDNANPDGHGRLIDPLGTDGGLRSVGLLFKNRLFEVDQNLTAHRVSLLVRCLIRAAQLAVDISKGSGAGAGARN